jgi:putative RNA 2'-phosphotransferase
MPVDLIAMSKFLSLILRHQPGEVGLTLDAHGWADVEELIRLVRQSGRPITRELLDQLVAENEKRRFAFSEDGRRIRASQGHSVVVDLGLAAAEPPEKLYHGTASRFLESIRAKGLHAASRQYVHLSGDVSTATLVGQRHGRPVVLVVLARAMHDVGFPFFQSANGVWLTERVPSQYLAFPESSGQ